MAVLLIPKVEGLSYIRLIEEQAHYFIPIRPTKFREYIPARDLCQQYSFEPEQLMEFLHSSDKVHGVLCESGALFVHPKGLTDHLRQWALKIMKSKKARHPFTDKAVLLC